MSKFKNQILTYLKGIAMGSADVVPGVSGGTVAFITGIYTELLDSIKSVDGQALKLLAGFKFKDFWTKVNGNFLLPLFLGIMTSLLTLAKLVKYLLIEEPISLWSFFFGLIIISSILVLREIKKWSLVSVLSMFIGIAIAYWITVTSPAETTNAYWFIFLSGCIAICAMILPGISGAFILLILGKYEFIITAITERDYIVIAVFALGCIVGLLSFARVVSWLLKNYHDIAVSLLAGFMIGSLNKVWPWKIALAFRINAEGLQVPTITKNVPPAEYLRQTGDYPLLFQAILFMALGVFIVVLIEKIAHYRSKPNQ
jgi:putative membrane protein